MAKHKDKQELLKLVKELVCRIEKLPAEELPCCPINIDEKKPRFEPIDWDTVPLIVNDSVIEIRPTHELKRMKNSGFKNDKIYVSIDRPHNIHASPPWYHPCDPAFKKEQEIREKNKNYIYPSNDLDNSCQMPPPDMKEMDCSCGKKRDIEVCKWKEYEHQPCKEKQERYLCIHRQY